MWTLTSTLLCFVKAVSVLSLLCADWKPLIWRSYCPTYRRPAKEALDGRSDRRLCMQCRTSSTSTARPTVSHFAQTHPVRTVAHPTDLMLIGNSLRRVYGKLEMVYPDQLSTDRQPINAKSKTSVHNKLPASGSKSNVER